MARFDKVIYLLSASTEYDEIGNPVETITERKVFAAELAVFSNEFYNAAAAGLRAERKFEIYTDEYQGEEKLKYDDVTYRIIRTSYGKSEEYTWVTCERVLGDG